MKMQIVAAIPCVLMITLMAFCAGIQVASLAPPINPSRFNVGYGWLAGDLIGLVVGCGLLFKQLTR